MLIAQEQEIAQFVEAMFRYADEGTVVGLRSFTHDKNDTVARVQGWPSVRGDMRALIAAATKAATEAANSPVPLVFCPPIATFRPSSNGEKQRAREADLANGVSISVELDGGNTFASQTRLEHLLGPVTMAVASGGEWADPETGEVFPKLHLHWRLSEPTRTADEHKRLKQARDLAMVYVGADPTAVPLVHPLRWPGSWHRKGTPKLAKRSTGNPAAEVHLEDALSRLEEAVEAAGLLHAASDHTAERQQGQPSAQVARLRPAVMAIPNADVHWDEWTKIGLLIHRASGGNQAGLDLWIDWSQKSGKYVAGECDARWTHFDTHPLSRAGAGTLFYMAKMAGWSPPRPSDEPPPDDRDEGYYRSLEAELALTADEEDRLRWRETGRTAPAPASPQTDPATQAAATPKKDEPALWQLRQPWSEADIPQRPWIAHGYLMRGAVTVVSGPGSAGKSSLMVAWAAALVLGCAFGRFKPTRPMRVVTYNVEDDEQEQKRRFSAMAGKLGVPVAQFMDNLAILGPTSLGTLLVPTVRGDGVQADTSVMLKLREFLDEFQPDVVILDPFVELHAAEENDNTAIRAVIAAFRAMAISRTGHPMSVVLLHHARKGAGTPGDPDSLRGASSIVGAARVALTLNVMTDEEAEKSNISSEHRRDYFRLDGAKSNYAPIEEAEWFQREVRVLANGDAVAVAWPWKPPDVWREMAPASIAAALDRIAAGLSADRLYAPSKRGADNNRWVGNVLMEIMGHSEAQAKQVIAGWLRSGLLIEKHFRDPLDRKEKAGVIVDRSKAP